MKTSFLIFGLICISGTLLAEIEVRFTRLTPEMLDSGKLPFQLMAFGPIGRRAKIKTVPMPNTKERFN
jgi:hypothetical protein